MIIIPKLFTAAFVLATTLAYAAPDPNEFKNPTNPYLPRTWMHLMNGNLSKEGFTKDIEALADAGIGGALVFHIARGIPDGPTQFGSDAFNDVLVHAAVEAERVGIEMGLHNCDGWSSSGGPWVTPEQSMKKVVFAETVVSGGLQKIELPKVDRARDFYRDIAVLAWPAPIDVDHLSSHHETLRSSDEDANLDLIRDGNIDTELTLDAPGIESPWIQSSYPTAVTIRSLVTEQRSRHGKGFLWISEDGIDFTEVGPLKKVRIGKSHWSFEQAYPEGITAKHFRILFDSSYPIRRFELSAYPRMSDWQTQNAMVKGSIKQDGSFPENAIISRKQIHILNQGELPPHPLQVDLPPGSWIVTRYGYTTTGAHNHPASDAGRGLEIDKLDAAAMDFHFEQYVGKVVKEAQSQGSNALLYSEIDSFEMGGNNWTENFNETFEQKWGYDLLPWLPAFSGHVIESSQSTDAVLTDMRGLVADLMTENYFERFTELCHQYNMKSYVEPYGFGTLNELSIGGSADKTMGEFWVVPQGFMGIFASAVSSARIYGKKVISAESFTAWSEVNWRGHPYSMKIYGDHAWASGINETMFHRYAHQPNTHVIPGMTMGSVGSHIDRTQTWWNNAGKAWFKYLARGSYLLQQGNPASDFLVFTGDNTPNRVANWNSVDLPAGVRGDFVNADVLINRLSVKDGKLVLPEGTSYNAIYLHNSDKLRLATLKRIEQLARNGALIVGPAPSSPIGYTEYQSDTAEFQAIVSKLWANSDTPTNYGKGQILPSRKAADALEHLGLGPDLLIDGIGAEYFTHRKIGQGELYFFFNETDEYREMNLDFRVSNRIPEIWDADTGSIERLDSYQVEENRTRFTTTVEPRGSRFVYFREPLGSEIKTTPSKLALLATMGLTESTAKTNTLLLDLNWQIEFDKTWGGPGLIETNTLQDWTLNEVEGIRHFSGTAIYRSQFDLNAEWATAGQPIALDLGSVDIAAIVTVNETTFPTLWKPPFALDVSSALKAGTNSIQIEVTNTWTNRLIGDEGFARNDGYEMDAPMPKWFSNNEPPPESDRYTWTAWNFYNTEESRALEPSGLKGPVRLIRLDP